MKPLSQKNAGLCLLLGSFLMFVTMILHPTGGDMDHLMEIWYLAVISHSIAIASVPITALGFWGLTQRIHQANLLAYLAFSFVITALIAAMMAATLNGLVLPIYVDIYHHATPSTQTAIQPILRYGFALNHAFDYIFMAGVLVATFLYSVGIIRTGQFPKWLGFLGIAIGFAALLMWMAGFVFVNLQGFRLFVFGWMGWIISAGYFMRTRA